ncbi:MAG: sigma-70 family RNA polymerase sigma factor [Candidatus Omnitrophica bacterium]|nr:sigma-70 family RNA polymerase sigma factor [Candidatus Omnitrophota bacterium]
MLFSPDEELIQKVQKGDKEAYRELFVRHNKKIYTFLVRYLGNRQDAEEITVDVFLAVYDNMVRYREEGKFLSWVYRIALNLARKRLRAAGKKEEISYDLPLAGEENLTVQDTIGSGSLRPDNLVIEKELHEAINEIVAGMGEQFRQVLLLCDTEGMAHEKVAELFKCSVATVGTRLYRARAILCRELRKRGYTVEGKKINE